MTQLSTVTVDEDSKPIATIDEALRARIGRALALGGDPVLRLGAAGTSVTFRIVGGGRTGDDDAFTLLLDRTPPELSEACDAEITVELGVESAHAFAGGELVLGNAIVVGAARSRGPIRRYLTVDPILRRLLSRVARGEGS